MGKPFCILQVSTSDGQGGAEKVAYNLHRSYRAREYPAWLAVGSRRTDDPYVLTVPNDACRYQAVKRDATAYDWRRKREIYARSHLYVATPCRWLMEKVEQSILAPPVVAPPVVEARVIPYGVDLSVFHQADKRAVRAVLALLQEAFA